MADREEMLVIPYRQLSAEALLGLIEEFVTRHGTDSGYTRGSLEENVAMVRRQLDAGEALVVFDDRSLRPAIFYPPRHCEKMLESLFDFQPMQFE